MKKKILNEIAAVFYDEKFFFHYPIENGTTTSSYLFEFSVDHYMIVLEMQQSMNWNYYTYDEDVNWKVKSFEVINKETGKIIKTGITHRDILKVW